MSVGNTKIDLNKFPGMTEDQVRRMLVMTDDEIIAAAMTDPDNPPLTEEQLTQFRPLAVARKVRQKLRMGRQSFAEAYGIPLDTLRAWERHEAVPTPAEEAYLRLIEREPEVARIVTFTPVEEPA